uniref:GM09255p n=1 Tax=Drosophila melanogaster TaxID=7227 RepID=Q95S46_DROME|nr:GM09255p [Drosophila melanogaster]
MGKFSIFQPNWTGAFNRKISIIISTSLNFEQTGKQEHQPPQIGHLVVLSL